MNSSRDHDRRRLATRLLLIAVLAATIGCDRVTKRFATETLADSAGHSFLADTVRVGYAENSGGFLSLGAGLPSGGRTAIFVVASGLLLAATLATAIHLRWTGLSMIGVTFFVAGGASNWIDRVVHGRVVDFMNVGVGSVRTGVFNVADVAIMVGLGLLLWAQFAEDRHLGYD